MLVLFITPRLAWELELHVRSTPDEALNAISGRDWPMGAAVEQERHVAVAVGNAGETGKILAVGRFVSATKPVASAGRRRRSVITSSRLDDRHPLSRLVGTSPDWCIVGRNPIKYVDVGLETSNCLCGCDAVISGAVDRFLPGHDQRMLHDRVGQYFGGSILETVRYLDRMLGET